MMTKLTLKMDDKVIEKAKLYAQKRNTSLSKLVETYLSMLTSKPSSEPHDVTPFVKSLSGILDASALKDYKETYKRHLKKKYGK